MASVAWIQNNIAAVMFLGREVVYDRLNIEFRQAEERIIFTENKATFEPPVR
jgi:hypothetical protein